MSALERAGDLVADLALARQEAPSEVAVAPDGTQAVIQWQGTPASQEWLSGWVARLQAAKLIEPSAEVPKGDTKDAQVVRAANVARLEAWHRALGGLPREGLEAARVHFERYGLPEKVLGYYLRPIDVSRWVRARAARRIPLGRECGKHSDQWAHDCRKCSTPLSPEEARGRIAAIRAELAQRREGGE